MNVKMLLTLAKRCKTEEDAEDFLEAMGNAFSYSQPLLNLELGNGLATMEDGMAHVSFELSQEISQHYIAMIRPEVRAGKMAILVVINQILDGLGMGGRSWRVVEGTEQVIEASDESIIFDLATKAKELAIENHAQLIESVGVPRLIAQKTALELW